MTFYKYQGAGNDFLGWVNLPSSITAEEMDEALGSGAFTINDILREANKEPINEPWADTHFMTMNIGDIASARSMEAQKGGNAE